MTRRSLLSLFGRSWLPSVEPGVNTLHGTITIPSDGDAAVEVSPRTPALWFPLGFDKREQNFEIMRPALVDHRDAAREFVRTGKPGAFMQRLVRGHWQRYYTGPVGQKRVVFRHKEPYWQGDQDAPIALREHVLGAGT